MQTVKKTGDLINLFFIKVEEEKTLVELELYLFSHVFSSIK